MECSGRAYRKSSAEFETAEEADYLNRQNNYARGMLRITDDDLAHMREEFGIATVEEQFGPFYG